MKTPRFLMIAAAVVATSTVITNAPVSSQPQQPPPTRDELGHVRVERTFVVDGGWASRCEPGACRSQILFLEDITTPTNAENVDVVMTATFNYRTSRGDGVKVQMSPSRVQFPLGLSRRATSATLAWAVNDVEAAGKQQRFLFAIHAKDRNHDQHAVVRGKKVTVVIEMWPAGE